MKAKVPGPVCGACTTLREAGFEAWVVGGAVRDLVLGKTPSDWDVASDALPEEVLTLFERTVATGLQHGTVTVLLGPGSNRTPVEITTFRGEGAYSDSRRPDSVHFGVPLDEDLKRRDFVMNAMAFDPIEGKVHDPFDGVGDLRNRVIRAVGVAEKRFAEDGLRVMRAVRFVSTLDFALDADTESAIGTALDALSKVAMERVRVELLKLLAGPAAVRALLVAEKSGVLKTVLPQLTHDAFEDALARIKVAPQDPVLRLATLLWGVPIDSLDDLLRHLKMSNEERKRILSALRHMDGFKTLLEPEHQVREFLSMVGRQTAPDVLRIAMQEAKRTQDSTLEAAVLHAEAILASDVALEIGDLAISGGRVMELAGVRGPVVGETLRRLLVQVLEDPARNQIAFLERAAADLISRG